MCKEFCSQLFQVAFQTQQTLFPNHRTKLWDFMSKQLRAHVGVILNSCSEAQIYFLKKLSPNSSCVLHTNMTLSRSDCGLLDVLLVGWFVGLSVCLSVSWSALFYILRGLQTGFWHRRWHELRAVQNLISDPAGELFGSLQVKKWKMHHLCKWCTFSFLLSTCDPFRITVFWKGFDPDLVRLHIRVLALAEL